MKFNPVIGVLVTLLIVSSSSYAAQKLEDTFVEILNEINAFIGSLDFKLLADAAQYAANPYPYSSYRRPHASGEGALAMKLLAYYRSQPITGYRQRLKFTKIYNEKVKQPCEIVLQLSRKCDSYIKANSTDDWDHSFAVLPTEWFKSVEICQKESIESTYRQFKRLRRSD